MKRVFSNAMVAHVWAQQTQSEGHSANGQFYFRDTTIYSYGSHFPIARFVTNEAGQRAVLFTTRDYSITTSAHKGDVHRALHGSDLPVFHTPQPDQRVSAEQSLTEYRKRFVSLLDKAKRARKCKADYLNDARNLSAEAWRFAGFFGFTMEPLWSDDWEATLTAAQVAEEAERAQRHAASLKRDAEARQLALEAWNDGRRVYNLTDEKGAAYLRINGDVVETSRGAEVPVNDARTIFPFIIGCRKAGKSWHRNGSQIPVGDFQLDAIDAEGNIRAGCHLIMWPQIERIAGELGLSVD